MGEIQIRRRFTPRTVRVARLLTILLAFALWATSALRRNPVPEWLEVGLRPALFNGKVPFSQAFATYLETYFPHDPRVVDPHPPYPIVAAPHAKNCILLIGDGMGLSHVCAAGMAAYGLGGRLAIQRMPIVGLVETYSSSSLFTDSGAAATALATGRKTYNGAIAMDPFGRPLESFFATAKRRGMRTGLVVTSSLTHGTPAPFVANVPWRTMEPEVAAQLLERDTNVLFGGGAGFFIPRSTFPKMSFRYDNRDLLVEALRRGYKLTMNPAELPTISGDHVMGLFGLGPLPPAAIAKPSLAEMTSKSLQLLSRGGEGFCLMVEGSQIDWQSHRLDFEATIWETLEFERAVERCLEFAAQDGQTLVVVTADHETGGLALTYANNVGLTGNWAYSYHTATMVPLWAYGPGCLQFAGVQDNIDVPVKIAGVLGLDDFPALRERIASVRSKNLAPSFSSARPAQERGEGP